jgi:superfamily II DNA or RNA helicase
MLTRQGYRIEKSSLTAQQTAHLLRSLTVAPKLQCRKGQTAESFSIYGESETRYYIPRVWGAKEYGPATKSILPPGTHLRSDLTFIGNPYDYQKDIVKQFMDADANGLLCVPCGRGKTFMAIQIAYLLRKKFLIVVDKEFLLQQWSNELKSLMPGIRIGTIQGDLKQIDTVEMPELTIAELKAGLKELGLPVKGAKPELLARFYAAKPKETLTYDCSIAMIQTLVSRDFHMHDFDSFGFTIFDECHHLGAAHFSRALLKVQTKHMLGLSATPTRDDGLTKVFEWFIGEPVYWEKIREADPDVIVRRVSFTCEKETYTKVPVDYTGSPVLARLLTQIVECEERNELIDGILVELLKEPLRKTLVLGDRIEHLRRIEANLPKGTRASYYIGGMKEDEREEGARTSQILLGSYAMASEAMNIKTLNTMIMITPRKKIEQSTGRILRVQKDKRDVQPLIIDIVDSHNVYQGQWLKRRAYYKKCSYKIEYEKAEVDTADAADVNVEAPKTEGKALFTED